MKTGLTVALGGLMLAGSAFAQDFPAGDPAHGETLIGKCRTCHGADGIAKLVIAPNISGEPEAYLTSQLAAFRDGTRKNEMMSIVVRDLGDQDIADMAAWYASQSVVATLEADPSGAPEACVACHGANGVSEVDDAPYLAGDSKMYLEAQLKAFRDGSRVSEVMNAIAADLTDEDIAAAADWYSAISLTVE